MQDIEIAPRNSRGVFLLVHILGVALGACVVSMVGYFVANQVWFESTCVTALTRGNVQRSLLAGNAPRSSCSLASLPPPPNTEQHGLAAAVCDGDAACHGCADRDTLDVRDTTQVHQNKQGVQKVLVCWLFLRGR